MLACLYSIDPSLRFDDLAQATAVLRFPEGLAALLLPQHGEIVGDDRPNLVVGPVGVSQWSRRRISDPVGRSPG